MKGRYNMFKKNSDRQRFNQPPFGGPMPQFPGEQQFQGGPQFGGPQFGGPQFGGPQFGGQQFPGGPMPQQPGSMLPGMQFERLQFEIMENRRRINNLAKRMARIESYLRIRDTPEYGYVEEDQKPNNFSY
jgi:hypothetical protein